MSSLFRSKLGSAALCSGLGVAASLAPVGSAQAAQTFFQPKAEARIEQNTNRTLSIDPATEEDILGYIVDLEGTWTRRTETSDTRIRPRLRFQEYPDNNEIQRSEQFLDLTTRNQVSERSRWELAGSYSRRDAFKSELFDAEFDELDPENPDLDVPSDGGDTGLVLSDDTRTSIRLRPGFSHQFTELTGLGLRASYDNVRYDSDTRGDRSDYDNVQLNAALTRQLDPRTVLTVGPYAARYETVDDRNTTDSFGVEFGWDRQWSERFDSRFRLYGERSEIEFRDGAATTEETDNNFGGELAGIYRTETGRIRYSVGRRFEPASAGSRTVMDELRVQYDWNYSQRLGFRTAVRAFQREAQGSSAGGDDRDYARAEFGLTWMMTPTVFVGTGYEYTWQERDREGTSAKNHLAYISFGYLGLAPRR